MIYPDTNGWFRKSFIGKNKVIQDCQLGVALDKHGKDLVLQQYTGLKDKNGKEIYEGDILQLRNEENKPYHMEVLWTGQGYGYKIIRNDTKRSGYIVGHLSERGLNFYNKTAEIIGNIYENPELLNS
ncbi:hypothetical protein AMS60_05455 [Bacillus sp. FJAT-21945]|nr:hypothetical protein AMS60_05455 [Bacillus sp. FJAT-21945]